MKNLKFHNLAWHLNCSLVVFALCRIRTVIALTEMAKFFQVITYISLVFSISHNFLKALNFSPAIIQSFLYYREANKITFQFQFILRLLFCLHITQKTELLQIKVHKVVVFLFLSSNT